MDQLHCIRNFVAVADAGGFAAAARRLGVSPASVTRAVAELELQLGVTLFTRTTRVVRVTDAGARYAEDCRHILAALDEADSAASGLHGTPRGRVVLTAPVLFGNRYVAPVVTEFLAAHPQVQALCLFVDRILNMDEEAIDVAVRIGELPDSSLQAVRVGTVRTVLVASPDYLARRGRPRHPQDLAQHTLIAASGLTPAPRWRFQAEGAPLDCEIRAALTTTTNDAALTAALGSFGITRLLSYQVSEPLQAGWLQTVLEGFEPGPVPVHVLHRQGRRPIAKVRALLDLLIERLRADASLDGTTGLGVPARAPGSPQS